MTEEQLDFEYFRDTQLHAVDFDTGVLDTIRDVTGPSGKKYKQRRLNVGSINPDGYSRVWCRGSLRMKHRLLYFLYHGELPLEIDHIDRDRSNNSIHNLRSVTRTENNIGIRCKGRKKFTQEELHEICKLIATKSLSDDSIAKMFSCSRIAIMGIRHKRRHKKVADMYF
ncbi:MAG: HNH endonuclease signature motif containing protein [Cetobacterium sp.]|uniref:HNH endonuclease signature motif containing protein n=1 Tax=Cetobacterium sp. TaxID=2071632 RepID=UPI003EE53EA0